MQTEITLSVWDPTSPIQYLPLAAHLQHHSEIQPPNAFHSSYTLREDLLFINLSLYPRITQLCFLCDFVCTFLVSRSLIEPRSGINRRITLTESALTVTMCQFNSDPAGGTPFLSMNSVYADLQTSSIKWIRCIQRIAINIISNIKKHRMRSIHYHDVSLFYIASYIFCYM